jgi:hypothetical protein
VFLGYAIELRITFSQWYEKVWHRFAYRKNNKIQFWVQFWETPKSFEKLAVPLENIVGGS